MTDAGTCNPPVHPGDHRVTARPAESPAWRWFWPTLAGIIVVAALCRFLLRAEYLAHHPLATHLILDAATYWEWAGRIASGRLSDTQPFFSAPLYPHLLGLLRAVGGGLGSVYTVQILLDLVTATLLAWIGRVRFGAAVGLLAAALFLLMLEPASYSLRVLACTLQLPLVCVAWLSLLAAQHRPSLARALAAGAALGLLALAYPPALACLPIFGLWWWWVTGHTLRGAGRAGLAVLAGLAVISPATIHNYRACGEAILISAQAGITFAQGNAPGADGIYKALPGVARDRQTQNRDALRVYQQSTGRAPSWRAVSRFFFQRGLDYWHSEPAAALQLLATKAYWFLTGHRYDDIYVPAAEQAEGLLTRLRLVPLHTPWLILPALPALVVWARRLKTYLPELMLFALPPAVVLAFWYSPRYRLPAVPVIVMGCAWTLWRAVQAPTRRGWSIVLAVALAGNVGLHLANRALRFDRLEPRRAHLFFGLGWAASQAGQFEQAVDWYQRVLPIEPGYPSAAANLGAALVLLGRPDQAIPRLLQAIRADPQDSYAHNQLARALVAQNRLDEALSHFQVAVRLRPDSADHHHDLAVTLLRAGDAAGAAEHWQTALRIDPTHAKAHLMWGTLLQQEGQVDQAIAHLREAVRLNPTLVPGYIYLSRTLWAAGDIPGGIAALRRAHELSPDDVSIMTDLAAALAAGGRFAEAIETLEQALILAEKQGAAHMAQELRRRLQEYKAGNPDSRPDGSRGL
jgi:tetratricopeptide (TPR) repeat protein